MLVCSSRAKFDNAIFRVCKYYSENELTFILSDDVKDYIWELTNGQPAAVRAVLDGLSSSEVRDNTTSRETVRIANQILQDLPVFSEGQKSHTS